MKRILLLSHASAIEGPIDYYEKFLIREGYDVSKFTHPLDQYDNRSSRLNYNNVIAKEYKRNNAGFLLNLLMDFALSAMVLLRGNYQIIVCANNFDCLAPFFLKFLFLKKFDKVIYFASDFSEERFKNKVLDKIYYLVEKIAIKIADLTISNTARAQTKRKELGLRAERSLIIPNGVHLKNLVFKNKLISKDHFIYVGSVTKEHGLYELINTLAPIVKKLVIIGSGEDFSRVTKLCGDLKLDHKVYFQKSHEFVIDYLQNFDGIGLAPYNTQSKWTYYCSPLKVSEYVACGVPVIISNVPEISITIEREKLGILYSDMDLKQITDKLRLFEVQNYHRKAELFYQQYSQTSLYKQILN